MKPKVFSCADGMCGALDCPTCHPMTWRNEVDEAEMDNEPDVDEEKAEPFLK